MSNENGDAPKVEGAEIARTDGQAESAEPDRAAEKGKRVAPYLFPNVLLIAVAMVMWVRAVHLYAPLSFAGVFFAAISWSYNGVGDYKNAARIARVARVLFWTNFIWLAARMVMFYRPVELLTWVESLL